MSDLRIPGYWPFINGCVVVGPGLGRGLASWQALRPRRLILIEPDPDTAADLLDKTRDAPGVEVWQTAVTTEDKARLYRFEPHGFDALSPATQELAKLFPGLTAHPPRDVPALSPQDMMRRLSLSPDTAHVLIIEAPALAQPILSTLDATGVLHRFLTIRFRGSACPLYEGETPFEDTAEWLAARGYTILSQVDRDDPDRPVMTASLDVVDDLRTRLTSATAAEEAARNDLNTARADLEKLQAELDASRATERAAVRDLQDLQNQFAALGQDHDALIAAVKAHLASEGPE